VKICFFSESVMLLFMLIVFPIQLAAIVRLPTVFSDNMVIQQNIPFQIWGWAAPNEHIAVKCSWLKTDYKISADPEGNWRLSIPSPITGGPYQVSIKGQNEILIQDVFCGEVWICSGQSNMEMGMKIISNAAEEIRQANYPGIRLFDVRKAERDTLLSGVKGKWKICTPESVSEGDWEGFSALAYFFGRRIHEELRVPVGLIDISWGATHIEPWIAPEGYLMVEEVLDLYQNRFQVNSGGVWGEPYRPSRIYNAMVAPLGTFSFRGVLWYQGESNVGDGMQYYYKMKALIDGWREVWKQGDFPFYFVQIAPYQDYTEGELEKLWEAQKKALEISNTGMAKTEDIGDWNDIHPKNKLEVGERLAKIALNNIYKSK